MSWEIKDVGWPIPYRVNPYSIEKKESPYIMKHRDELYILPYGYTYFPVETYKGRLINEWV